ncbi:histidinol dehydrogenase [Ruminobacter amylophilus]|uniref:histidinol dehydrogenase n=1 Tax=Ruminobacter amylophilus TaxID=867 RepID=UPI003864DC44
MKIVSWKDLNEQERVDILTRPATADDGSKAKLVADIISNIRNRGDEALLEYSRKFDRLESDHIKLTADEIKSACDRVDSELKTALKNAYDNISMFHRAQKPAPVVVSTRPGVTCELHTHPIDSVGLYVPGGSAPLVSTVLMLAVPAQIAECPKVILCSPPPVSDAIVYAATLCGVNDIYTVGGAQAIAAMAYGTETVPKVNKIFGPGNSFVTEAKKQVSADFRGAAIDMPAGPSEVLVIADESANPAFAASDLLSQAEHGPDSQVVLLSTNPNYGNEVITEVEKQVQQLSRKDIANRALEKSIAIVCESLEEACAISNIYAPEHLIVETREPRALLPYLRNAGSIFIGGWTPESVGDYASGTNHTLPTYGYAKTCSSLGLADYLRRYTVQEATTEGLTNLSRTVELMADAEGLTAHKRAVTIRMDILNGAK